MRDGTIERVGGIALVLAAAGVLTNVTSGQGGEDASTATDIPGMPFLDTGTTVGFADDTDEVCPFTGSTSPDVWYRYIPEASGRIDLTLCNSDYDTKVYIYDNEFNLIACNDDACSDAAGNPFRSRLDLVELTGGVKYFIVIDGWEGDAGDYTLEMDDSDFCETLPPFLDDVNALDFDGADGTHVNVGVFDDLDFDPPFTLEAWVRPYSTDGWARIASTRGDDVVTGSGFGQLNGGLVFTTFGILDYYAPSAALVVGQWTHVAVVFDESFDAHFYIDGVLAQTITGSTPQNPSVNSFDLGRNPSIDQQVWDGLIDEVRYWSRVRTQEEIAADRDAVLTGTEPDLVGYWRFEEGEGKTASDSAGDHDGTLVGPAWLGLVECGPPCPQDVDASGDVGFSDLLAILANWGPCAGCSEDLDGSGDVGFADLLAVLANWGPCPVATGACCLPGECQDLTAADCAAMGGSYTTGTSCADVGCPSDDGWLVTAPIVWPGDTCAGASDCDLELSSDERWVVTIPTAGVWTFSVCGAGFDTLLYLGSTPCGDQIALSDDDCDAASEITMKLDAGTYYLTLEGFSSGECGGYTLTVE
ncbi:MAG: LamG domain-containing protein [Phycisphaerales bacterium]|nr:LamG domain-containing protein [Phycisphaerales bacterium]